MIRPRLIDASDFCQSRSGNYKLFTLRNGDGLTAQITNYGGRVVSLWTKDRKGRFEDVVLGFDTIGEYLDKPRNFYGATIGRFANRIGNAAFTLDGKTHNLTKNEGENHLHGGAKGFQNKVWKTVLVKENFLQLSYLSKDGEEGYPGNLAMNLLYTLTEQNELLVEYKATIDKACPINLTHHSFFNLTGAGHGDILNHELQIHADTFIPVSESLIPTGNRELVTNTPMDFRESKKIGTEITSRYEQLAVVGQGYDHSFELNKSLRDDLAAIVKDDSSGRLMAVYTNEPAVQFYSVNSSNITSGKQGKSYGHHGAFCLETQHHPDSPNQMHFPSCILRAGQAYYSYCRYRFGVI